MYLCKYLCARACVYFACVCVCVCVFVFVFVFVYVYVYVPPQMYVVKLCTLLYLELFVGT